MYRWDDVHDLLLIHWLFKAGYCNNRKPISTLHSLPTQTHLDLGEVIQRPQENLVIDTLVVRKMAVFTLATPKLM